MRWTPEQRDAYLEKYHKWAGNDGLNPDAPDDGKEARLQNKCEKWLRSHGYPYFHDRSRKKNKAGWFDLTCLLPEGRTVYIELKSKSGKPSKEQTELRRRAKYLKHEVYQVRSYKAFLEIVRGIGVIKKTI